MEPPKFDDLDWQWTVRVRQNAVSEPAVLDDYHCDAQEVDLITNITLSKNFPLPYISLIEKEVHMHRDRRLERGRDLKIPTSRATILSVNTDAAPNTFRVSLQWQGNYEIWDFDLQQFGKILQIQDETPNSGWAVIERPFRVPVAHALPGSALNESTLPLSPGDTIPLRPDLGLRLRR